MKFSSAMCQQRRRIEQKLYQSECNLPDCIRFICNVNIKVIVKIDNAFLFNLEICNTMFLRFPFFASTWFECRCLPHTCNTQACSGSYSYLFDLLQTWRHKIPMCSSFQHDCYFHFNIPTNAVIFHLPRAFCSIVLNFAIQGTSLFQNFNHDVTTTARAGQWESHM